MVDNFFILVFCFSYSEEIFSQQSRKMSADSSLASELESEAYPSNAIGAAGDAGNTAPDTNKNDLNNLRIELQNKYHAELEILREDYENRIDELRINNENVQQETEKKYFQQIETLKTELEEAQKYVMTQQEVVSFFYNKLFILSLLSYFELENNNINKLIPVLT